MPGSPPNFWPADIKKKKKKTLISQELTVLLENK